MVNQLIKIGEFSRLGRVSVVTLRHYDDLGLLPAAHVDPESGYRYYEMEQLPRLHRILALKDLGFSLEQVARLLADPLPTEQLRGMLLLRRAELEHAVRTEQARLAAVQARLEVIEREGGAPAYDVLVRPVDAQLVASIRQVAPSAEAVEHLFDAVEDFAAAHNVRATAPPLAIYYDAEYRERDIDLEVAVPLTTRVAGQGRIGVRELPRAPAMACVVHAGSYATLDLASGALHAWIASQGYRVAGAYRELYLRFGAAGLPPAVAAYLAEDADQYLTELQVPVEVCE